MIALKNGYNPRSPVTNLQISDTRQSRHYRKTVIALQPKSKPTAAAGIAPICLQLQGENSIRLEPSPNRCLHLGEFFLLYFFSAFSNVALI
jgi:hypothetical protein